MRDTYISCIIKAGGIPVVLPCCGDDPFLDAVCQEIDGLLLTGGEDIDPMLYGQERSAQCGEICPERDAFDIQITKKILSLDKPLLGICRGSQILNVALGGTLYQDIPSEVGTKIRHDQERDFEKPAHSIQILPETLFHKIICERSCQEKYVTKYRLLS